jgi:elongation factor Ts
MAEVTAAMVKALRERTGAGMMDCKRALVESDGDMDKAEDWLRAKGFARAAAKAGRSTNEGMVDAYIHHAGGIAKQGALIEINCESDFVAKTDDFKHLAHTLALQVVGMAPTYVRREDVPAEVVERERAVYREQVKGKPENIVEKILTGKLDAFYAQTCLLEQPWIKDDKKKVGDLVTEAIAKLGENISIARFARFAVGAEDTDDAGANATAVA